MTTKMRSLSDQETENAIEAGAVDAPPSTIVSTGSHGPGSGNDNHNVDYEKTPEVFGKLWREVISVFTLACAPALNVCLRPEKSDRRR
jgi:hypothetical protein